METKVCTKCGEEKPATTEYFNKASNNQGWQGLNSTCRICNAKRCKERREKNPEAQKEYDKEYRAKNPEKVKKWKKEWDLNNQDYIQEYREKNKERDAKRISVWHKQNRKIHGDELNTKKREWVKKNPEHLKEYRRLPETKTRNNLNKKRRSRELTDGIVVDRLSCHSNLMAADFREYPELIKTERIRLKLYRESNV